MINHKDVVQNGGKYKQTNKQTKNKQNNPPPQKKKYIYI